MVASRLLHHSKCTASLIMDFARYILLIGNVGRVIFNFYEWVGGIYPEH